LCGIVSLTREFGSFENGLPKSGMGNHFCNLALDAGVRKRSESPKDQLV